MTISHARLQQHAKRAHAEWARRRLGDITRVALYYLNRGARSLRVRVCIIYRNEFVAGACCRRTAY